MRIFLIILSCLIGWNAHATSPFTNCNSAGNYLQSTTSTNPASPVCASGYPLASTTGSLPAASGGNTYTAIVTNSPYNASGYIAQTLTTGTVTSGTTNIPVASSAGFYAGHFAIVSLGGTSGNKNFAAKIQAVPDSTHVTLASAALTGAALNNAGPQGTATSGASGLTTAIAANYTIYTLGSTTIGSASNGATTVTLANVSTYQQGQGIFISGGAASGADLITKITGISGSVATISPGISNASGVASGTYVQHDDTVAFQTAVNLTTYSQNVNLYVPDGYYQINGAASGSANASVILPALDYWPGGTSALWLPQATLQITGNTPAAQLQSYLSAQKIPNLNGAILATQLGGTVNILGAYDGNSLQSMTNINLVIKNITFRAYPNPNVVMVNASLVQSLQIDHSAFDTGETGPTTQPGNVSFANFALIMPNGENGGENIASSLEVNGFYWGIKTSEHSRVEHVRFDNVFWPWVLGTSVSQYGITGVDVDFDGCPHGIGVGADSFTIPVDLSLMNFEHQTSPSWVTTVDDVSDTNMLTGFLSVDQQSQVITINGATRLHVVDANLSNAYPFPTTTFSGLSNSHYATAGNGTMVFCSDCTRTLTCAGSGNGATAQVINGTWSCSVPSVTSVIAGTGLSGGTITSTGTINSNAVYQVLFSPGLLTSVTNTVAMYGKISKASAADNIVASALLFSCISNPTITFYECGTSTTCASPTTIGSVTVTAAGQAFTGTVSNPAITAGDYVAWAITAGTCTSLDISASSQVHSN